MAALEGKTFVSRRGSSPSSESSSPPMRLSELDLPIATIGLTTDDVNDDGVKVEKVYVGLDVILSGVEKNLW